MLQTHSTQQTLCLRVFAQLLLSAEPAHTNSTLLRYLLLLSVVETLNSRRQATKQCSRRTLAF